MYQFKTARYMFFILFIFMFWMLVPLYLIGLVIGLPVPTEVIGVYFIFAYFMGPKISAWFVHNTPLGRVWSWAYAGEK